MKLPPACLPACLLACMWNAVLWPTTFLLTSIQPNPSLTPPLAALVRATCDEARLGMSAAAAAAAVHHQTQLACCAQLGLFASTLAALAALHCTALSPSCFSSTRCSAGSFMNLTVSIAVYASISKELGLPLR